MDVAEALRFARTSPDAVVLSLWPSAVGQNDAARSFLEANGATVVFETDAELPRGATAAEDAETATLLVTALYWGEDWLKTNCWYGEQPLEDLGVPGLRRPTERFWPGARWKKELCFRANDDDDDAAGRRLRVLVADVSRSRGRLWSGKYAVRARMARDTGRAGNSCMHLTDDQSDLVGTTTTRRGSGTDCNASYAFACARCLLNPTSLEFLRTCVKRFPRDDDRGSREFRDRFGAFCAWLADRNAEDVSTTDRKSVV